VWLVVDISSSKVYKTKYKNVVCSEVPASVVNSAIWAGRYVGECDWAWMFSGTLWESLPLCFVGAPSWCRGVAISWNVWLYLRERDMRYVRRSVGVWPVTYIWGSISGIYVCLCGIYSVVQVACMMVCMVHVPC